MKKTVKIVKPKKGDKVLCIAEQKNWGVNALFPPKIGWVYLVRFVEKMNADFTGEDPKGKRLGIGLVGFGIPKDCPNASFYYPIECFRVVGKAKINRA